MIIIESTGYKRSYKDNLVKKHKNEEIKELKVFIMKLEAYNTLKDFMNSYDKIRYQVTQKKGNIKELFAAKIGKIRIIFKPVTDYPYNYVEIDEIELIEVNDDHYKNI